MIENLSCNVDIREKARALFQSVQAVFEADNRTLSAVTCHMLAGGNKISLIAQVAGSTEADFVTVQAVFNLDDTKAKNAPASSACGCKK